MQRDMDLARRILMEIEKSPFTGRGVRLDFKDVPDDEVQYHLWLLWDARLIEAIDLSSHDGPQFLPRRLTWKGHEFLEAARNDTLWKKAKDTLLEKTGGLPFDLLLDLLKKLARKAVLGEA